jgi:hypothetical protein
MENFLKTYYDFKPERVFMVTNMGGQLNIEKAEC